MENNDFTTFHKKEATNWNTNNYRNNFVSSTMNTKNDMSGISDMSFHLKNHFLLHAPDIQTPWSAPVIDLMIYL